MFGQGNRDQTCETCWRQLPCGFKFLFIFTLVFNLLTIFFSFLISGLYFDGYLVVKKFQLWREIIPYFPAGIMPMSILNILINFLWLLSILPSLEKKFSTSYILIETFLQNLMINLTLTLLSIIAYYILSLDPKQYQIFNFGLFPMCMIFIWMQVSQNPDQYTTFCCMPCLIPMKWIPLILLLFCLILAPALFLPLLIASILGYLQFMLFKRRFIKLPLRFYRKIDSILPKSITNRNDYVRVQSVQRDLLPQCSNSASNAQTGSNPFERNRYQANQIIQESNKVEVIGKGISIGGDSSNAQNFKGFWANKTDEIEVEPVAQKMIFQQKKQLQSKQRHEESKEDSLPFSKTFQEKLNQSSPKDKSQEQFAEKDENKVAKQNLLI